MKKLMVLMALASLMMPVLVAAQGQRPDRGPELLAAAAAGNVERVKELLDNGVDIESKNKMGATPLMWAAMNGRSNVVTLLLERGANVNARTTSGVSALGAAASKGHAEVASILLRHGADVNARDDKGRTALDVAQAGGFTDVAELLSVGSRPKSTADARKAMQREQSASTRSSADARELQPSKGPVAVVTRIDLPENCLRIRSGPGVSYEKIGCANRGESLRLTGAVHDGWAQVQEPVQGWVSGGQIRAEGLFPAKQATSRYRGPSEGYSGGSDVDARLDRAEWEADRDIRRLRSQYPDYGPFFWGPGAGVVIGPYGIGIGIGR